MLTFTSLFPNAQQPFHGLFVRERVRALSRLCDLRVVAPVPWAPSVRWLGERYYRYSQVSKDEQQDCLSVQHLRFFIIPKVLKVLDAPMMAVCCYPGILKLRKAFPFDIIDAHWAYPDGVAAAILARFFGVPCSITVRGDDINLFAQQYWRRQLIRRAFRGTDLVVALSAELKRGVDALGVPPNRSVVIPNGIDVSRFYPVERSEARHRLRVALGKRILLSVGRLHVSKGHTILVEAFALLKDQFPSLEVVIAGGPDHEADARPFIDDIARRAGVSDRVHLIGSQPPDVLRDWYSAADLFCLATAREGSANVILEALACGLPCVTTPVGGNTEVITSPDLGILVSPKAQAMAVAITAGLSRDWNKEKIVGHARQRTWAVVAEECYLRLSNLVTKQ